MTEPFGFDTRAIHAGYQSDPATGDVMPPIHLSTTYQQDGIGGLRSGYEYTRGGNPTRDALQGLLAALEGGERAFAFASGLAAEDALLRALLKPGARIVMGNDVYGGTHRLVHRIHVPWGVVLETADLGDLDRVRDVIRRGETDVVWLETPSNPLMKITDIAALAEVAHAAGATVVVDNTFATPALQQPLALGADAVVHSVTKYLGGHSDVLGGAVVLPAGELAERVGFLQFATGGVAAPTDAWLTMRGIRTLGVRMERHSATAAVLAERLVGHPAVRQVLYPGLPTHPGHVIAARQMRLFGGMLSLRLAGGEPAARAFAESLRVFTLAESLGGVESLVNYPAEMTHASVRGTELEVPGDVVRLSVGLETADDLLTDVLDALEAVAGGPTS
ncbi:MAG: cystathionine gamma-synthase [Micrococcales bacterium]|nr:cystathionine gamma-synthase [Micrococcales bacterium]